MISVPWDASTPLGRGKFAGDGLLGAAVPDRITGSIESSEMLPGNGLAVAGV